MRAPHSSAAHMFVSFYINNKIHKIKCVRYREQDYNWISIFFRKAISEYADFMICKETNYLGHSISPQGKCPQPPNSPTQTSANRPQTDRRQTARSDAWRARQRSSSPIGVPDWCDRRADVRPIAASWPRRRPTGGVRFWRTARKRSSRE